MRNLMWRLTAVALDIPLLMLSLLVEWRVRLFRAGECRDMTALPRALPGPGDVGRGWG